MVNEETETRQQQEQQIIVEMSERVRGNAKEVKRDDKGKSNKGFVKNWDDPQENLDIRSNVFREEEEENHIKCKDFIFNIQDEQLKRFTSEEFFNNNKKGDAKDKEWWYCRHTLVLMGFLAIVASFTMRVNLSVAIVAMVGTRSSNVTKATSNSTEVCPFPDDYSLNDNDVVVGEFDWDEQTQGLVLGAFYWGNAATNFLGGRLAEYFGGRLLVGLGVVTCSLLTVVTPFCAWISRDLFIVIRILSGACQGSIFPSLTTLLSTWVTPKERSKFTSIMFTGSQVGTVVAMALSGWLCSSDIFGGWPSVFYVFGGLGLLWGIPWFILIRDRPEDHPRISQTELDYINKDKATIKQVKAISIPWKELGQALPFWAIGAACFGHSFGFFALLNGIPTYFSNILHFDIKSNGLLSALPYIGMTAASLIWGTVMTSFTQRGTLSIRTVRRISTAIGSYVPMTGLILMNFVQCDANMALLILCISVSVSSANYSGYVANNQDIAPNLSGSIMGMTNTMSGISGILAPGITGLITQGNQTPAAWQTMFLICAGILFVCTSFYITFMTDQIQSWNQPKEQIEPNEQDKHKEQNKNKEQDKRST